MNNANYKQNPTTPSNPTIKNRLLDFVRKKWFNRKRVEKEQIDSPAKPTRWVQIRILPIWVRVFIIILLLFIAMLAGYNIGYNVIGDGSSKETFTQSTWRHILDIINGKE